MINLQQNFALIVRTLQEKEQMKLTQIARDMGYTTTSQLHGAIDGESMLSTKAIIALIEKLNVNPTYLFLGKGEMFLSEESEVDSLQKKCSDWERKYFDVQDELFKSKAELERAIYRYNKLIDITSIALDKTQKPENKEEKSDSE